MCKICLTENRTWSILTTSGAIVKGVYGASSVFDNVNHTILIHGGYQSESFSTYSLSDSLLAFDPINLSWWVLVLVVIVRLFKFFCNGLRNIKCWNLICIVLYSKYGVSLWLMFICRKILRGSGQYKYLHSASLLGRYMFVFGGNTHNDTSVSQGAKCYSLNFMAYDIGMYRYIYRYVYSL